MKENHPLNQKIIVENFNRDLLFLLFIFSGHTRRNQLVIIGNNGTRQKKLSPRSCDCKFRFTWWLIWCIIHQISLSRRTNTGILLIIYSTSIKLTILDNKTSLINTKKSRGSDWLGTHHYNQQHVLLIADQSHLKIKTGLSFSYYPNARRPNNLKKKLKKLKYSFAKIKRKFVKTPGNKFYNGHSFRQAIQPNNVWIKI